MQKKKNVLKFILTSVTEEDAAGSPWGTIGAQVLHTEVDGIPSSPAIKA